MDTLDSLAAQAGGHLEQIYKFREKLLSSDAATPPRPTPPAPTAKKSTGARQFQFTNRHVCPFISQLLHDSTVASKVCLIQAGHLVAEWQQLPAQGLPDLRTWVYAMNILHPRKS